MNPINTFKTLFQPKSVTPTPHPQSIEPVTNVTRTENASILFIEWVKTQKTLRDYLLNGSKKSSRMIPSSKTKNSCLMETLIIAYTPFSITVLKIFILKKSLHYGMP
jgi:hypothetical protein